MNSKLPRVVPRGLAAQLALAFSLLSVVLTATLMLLFEKRAINQLELQIGQRLGHLAAQTADQLDRGMFERYREVALIALRPELVNPDYPPARDARALARVQQRYTEYEWLGTVGLDGIVQAADSDRLLGADVSAQPWFRGGLLGAYIGDVHEATLLVPATGSARRFVDFAFPLADTHGKVRGVLAAHLSWDWAREVAQSVLGSGDNASRLEVVILSKHGEVLMGPEKLLGKHVEIASFKPSQAGAQGDFTVARWADGERYLLGFQRASGYASYPGMGWIVMVRQQLGHAYAPVRALRSDLLCSGIALALLFSLVGVAVAQRITRPLKLLADSASAIQHGEAARIESPADSYQEVEGLRCSLNALVVDLDERRRQLEQLNDSLEDQVAARTAELRVALDTVRASESRIRAIVETAQDAFIGIDLEGRIIEWNKQAEQLLGWRRGEAIGKGLAELMLAERFRPAMHGAVLPYINSSMGGAVERGVERTVTDRHGVEIPVEMSTGLSGGGLTSTFGIFLRDITERKRIDHMKNEFVGTVSHELRTPLTAIRASLGLLADGALGPLAPDMQELIDICNNNCIRLNRLVDDMLDIQKIEAGMMSFTPTPQQVLPLAREAIRTMRSMANAAGVTLVLDSAVGAREAVASFDHDRMTQVLINLLSNAIRFAPPGTAVQLQVQEERSSVRLSVSDRGPGVPPALRERVFQPFVQLSSQDGTAPSGGTGLGLAICKRIVEEHGGSIAIIDAVGGGAVFQVSLPRVRLPAQASLAEAGLRAVQAH